MTVFLDPALLKRVQAQFDEEDELRQQIRIHAQGIEKHQRYTMSRLATCHSLPQNQVGSLQQAEGLLSEETSSIGQLKTLMVGKPFWRYNSMWSREMQTASFLWLLLTWLRTGQLLSFCDVGEKLGVPIESNDASSFHLTIEEYLHALISLTEEVARLAINSVTLGDYERPLQIKQLVTTIHTGFQEFSFKNDSLRRRADSIKYNIKKIEEVVYDLSLRNLISQDGNTAPA